MPDTNFFGILGEDSRICRLHTADGQQQQQQRSDTLLPKVNTRWPHGVCARLRIKQPGFEPLPGTLCCIFEQDT